MTENQQKEHETKKKKNPTETLLYFQKNFPFW